MASISQNYPGSTVQFVNSKNAPANIDMTTKPLTVVIDDPTLAAIVNIAPQTTNPDGTPAKGLFSFDFNTLAVGVCTGRFVADADMTPAGEKELDVEFSIEISDEQATGGSVSLGTGVNK